jgi:hypothetical protein
LCELVLAGKKSEDYSIRGVLIHVVQR